MTTSTFIDEIASFLTESNIMILGDFNIYTRETTKAENTIFNGTMATLRLEQHVSFLTKRITNLSNIMILGDFNIYTTETTNADNTIFNGTMATALHTEWETYLTLFSHSYMVKSRSLMPPQIDTYQTAAWSP